MVSNVQPHINFEGNCEAALELYKKAFGAEVMFMMRCGEAPVGGPDGKPVPENMKNKILHVSFKAGDTILLGSDGYNSGKPNITGIDLSLNFKTPEEAEKVFNALAEGGKINMPFGKTFFSPGFGMLKDKYGVGWMVHVPGPPPPGK